MLESIRRVINKFTPKKLLSSLTGAHRLRFLLILLVAFVVFYFLWIYINTYIFKPKAGVDDVKYDMTAAANKVKVGDEFTVSAIVGPDDSTKRVSAVKLDVAFDDAADHVDYLDYSQVPEYFTEEVIKIAEKSATGKTLHLVLVAKKTTAALQESSSSVQLTMKFKAKRSGIVHFKINEDTDQVVGTSSNIVFSPTGTRETTVVICDVNGDCPTITVTPPITAIPITPPADGIALAFSDFRFQGIVTQPASDVNKIKAKITIKKEDNTLVGEQEVEFIASSSGLWNSSPAIFNQLPAGKYKVFVKGNKHLQMKLCAKVNSAGQDCEIGIFTFQPANPYVIKPPSNEVYNVFLAGDLPRYEHQDGAIDSQDLGFLRNNLGSKNDDKVKIADLTLDKIVDTQDHSLPIFVLGLGINQDTDE